MASLGERMVGAMKADVKTFQEIEADPAAIGQAVTVIVIAGVASLIGNVFRSGVFGGMMALILSLISYALWSLLVVLIGTKLMPEPSTKADFNEAFRVIGFTAAPGVFNLLAIIPFLGPADFARDRDLDADHRRRRGARSAGLLQHRARNHRLPDCHGRGLGRDRAGADPDPDYEGDHRIAARERGRSEGGGLRAAGSSTRRYSRAAARSRSDRLPP